MLLPAPSSRLFSAILSGNIPELLSSSHDDLRPFLPALTRMVVVPAGHLSVVGGVPPLPPLEKGAEHAALGERRRKVIHKLIIGMGEANAIRSYLQLNFQVSTR